MPDEHKLPAQSAARALVPTEQSGSLVARGLEAIKNRQQALVLFGVETDAKKSFLEGVAAERRGDYAEAVKWYRKAADQGYAEAQFNLGMMYDEGRAPDEAPQEPYYHDQGAWYFCEREHWLGLAAEQGYVKAQLRLGLLSYDRLDVFSESLSYALKASEWPEPRGRANREWLRERLHECAVEATKWFRLAADQGNAEAQFNLGVMYANGQCIPQDYAAAVSWYRKAADQGYGAAQSNLGLMYDHGLGVAQDYAEAAKWFRLAAEQGNTLAQFNLGTMYYGPRGLALDYAEAATWFYRAAEQGDPDAKFNLGVIYANGQGVPQDYMRAYMWFDLAARSASDTDERDKAVKNRDSIAAKLTSVQIAETQRLLRQRTENHAS